MSRYVDEEDAFGDDDADDAAHHAGPDDADADLLDEDRPERIAYCPSCGGEIWEDAEQCPRCRTWLTDRDRHGSLPVNRSGLMGRIWVWVVIALVIAILGLWMGMATPLWW